MNSALKLLIFAFALSIVPSLAQDQHPILKPSQEFALPYTHEWIAALEHIRNVAGGDYDDDWCPVDILSFECVKEDDDIGKKGDVWSLRPQDIKSVIVLGDSISAGFGMLSGRPPLVTILEYRGKAFFFGADEDKLTLANFLRAYDENGHPHMGVPLGVTLPLAHQKELNFAISGSLSDDLPGQATRSIRALSQSRYANNLCQACFSVPHERSRVDPDLFERDVRETVEKLRTEMGNVFVNLIGLFNISNVYKAIQEDSYCRLIFDRSNLALCPCATGSDETRTFVIQDVDLLTVEYNRRLQKIAFDYGRGKSQKFAAVYQPALEEMSPEEFAQGFLSWFDCFHCAHRVMALLSSILFRQMSPILTILLRDLSDPFRFIFAITLITLVVIFSTLTGWNLSNLEFDPNALLSSFLHFFSDMIGLNSIGLSLLGSTFRSSNVGVSTWSTSADEHDRQQHFEEDGDYVYGLVNTGNSCFLNSVLQALSALDSLPAYLLSLQQQSVQSGISQSQQQRPPQAHLTIPVINALLKTIRQLKTPLSRRSSFRPTRLVAALSSNNRIINREQQDAQELFQIVSSSLDDEERNIERMIKESCVESLFNVELLRKLSKEGGYKFNGNAMNNFAFRGSVIERGLGRNLGIRASHGPKNPFTGLLASRLSCRQCGYTEAIRHFTFDNISLPLPSSYTPDTCTLNQCFSLFTSLESLQDVVCRKCSLEATYKSMRDHIVSLQSMSTRDTGKIATLQSKQALVESALKEDIERDLGPDIPLKKHISISTKQVMLAKPPQILTLHLSRSAVHPSGVVFKNGSRVTFDEYLDVTPFVTGGTLVTQPDIRMSRPDFCANDLSTNKDKTLRKRYLYKLKSIVVHFGSHSFGHFVAYRRRARRQCECMDCQAEVRNFEEHAHREDEWYRISDEKVDPCRLVDVLRANPYMLLYERLNDAEIEQRERERTLFAKRTGVELVHIEDADLREQIPYKEKDANLLLMGDIGARANDDTKGTPIQESSLLTSLQPSITVSPPLDKSSSRISKSAEPSDVLPISAIPSKSKKSKRRKNRSINNLTTSLSSQKFNISVPSSPSASLSMPLSSSNDQPNQSSSIIDHSSVLSSWSDHAESRSRHVSTVGSYLLRQIERKGASPTSGGAVVVAVN